MTDPNKEAALNAVGEVTEGIEAGQDAMEDAVDSVDGETTDQGMDEAEAHEDEGTTPDPGTGDETPVDAPVEEDSVGGEVAEEPAEETDTEEVPEFDDVDFEVPEPEAGNPDEADEDGGEAPTEPAE